MSKNNLQPLTDKNKKTRQWVLICYGNILRSQVLEQYLRHYSKLQNINVEFHSAGVAEKDEFPDTEKLLLEISIELNKRGIPHSLHRDTWNKEIENKISAADTLVVADNKIKRIVMERMNNRINKEKIFTFYQIISEGEKDFEDTYDYENNRQDPVRFRNAFDELDRIAQKILKNT